MSDTTLRVFRLRDDNIVDLLFEAPFSDFTSQIINDAGKWFGEGVYYVEGNHGEVKPTLSFEAVLREDIRNKYSSTMTYSGTGSIPLHDWLRQVTEDSTVGSYVRCAAHGDPHVDLSQADLIVYDDDDDFIKAYMAPEISKARENGLRVVCNICKNDWTEDHFCN